MKQSSTMKLFSVERLCFWSTQTAWERLTFFYGCAQHPGYHEAAYARPGPERALRPPEPAVPGSGASR